MTHLHLLQRCLEDLRERNKVSAKETTTILITEVSAYLSDAGFLGLEKSEPVRIAPHKNLWGESKAQNYASFLNGLIVAGADGQVAFDFMEVRKSKKAVNSYSAFTLFMKTVEKSGKTLNEILEICVEMNWKGFRLAWLESHEIKQKSAQKPTSNQPVYKSPNYLK